MINCVRLAIESIISKEVEVIVIVICRKLCDFSMLVNNYSLLKWKSMQIVFFL